MKKVLIAVLMSTILVGSLAACGSEQSSNQETTAAQGTTAAQQQTTAVQATTEPQNVGAVGMWQATDNKTNYSLIINGDSTFTMTMETDEESSIASGTYTIDSAGAVTMTAQSVTTTNKKTGETKEETPGENDKAMGTYSSASDTIALTSNGKGINLKFTRVS